MGIGFKVAGSGVRSGIENKEDLGVSRVFFPKNTSSSAFFPEMTAAEKAAEIRKLFGAGTYESRAQQALPGILQRLQTNTPTLSVVPTGQGLLQSLATKGMDQIASGQAMNPTILKAKG